MWNEVILLLQNYPTVVTPLIINFAPTGMVPCKNDNANVPTSVSEIVDEVLMANELGITIVHLHARDKQGNPTLDPDIYASIIDGIRKHAPELVICISLSGRNDPSLESRLRPLTLTGSQKPDMASLTLSSLNFKNQASINEPNTVLGLAKQMRKVRVLPELEAFDSGMIRVAQQLVESQVLRDPCYINLLFGNCASASNDLLDIANMVQRIPSTWSCALAGISKSQLPANAIAIALNLGVRVGLEDNLYYQKSVPASNLQLLNRVHNLASIHQRPIMKSCEFRDKMKLQRGNGIYGTLE